MACFHFIGTAEKVSWKSEPWLTLTPQTKDGDWGDRKEYKTVWEGCRSQDSRPKNLNRKQCVCHNLRNIDQHPYCKLLCTPGCRGFQTVIRGFQGITESNWGNLLYIILMKNPPSHTKYLIVTSEPVSQGSCQFKKFGNHCLMHQWESICWHGQF